MKGDISKAAAALEQSRSDLAAMEEPIELAVSAYIRFMPFLWLPIDDEPGPESLRGVVERNTIALVSNFDRLPSDGPPDSWLGHLSGREKVRRSGLWNQRHVDEDYDPAFLDGLTDLISQV